ncbi:MAG: hypothetical protein Q7R48_00425 [bacterium]|nr:hypothetical protein [bacterium]
MTMASTEEQVQVLTRRVSAGDRRRRILFRRVRFLEEQGAWDQRHIVRLQRGQFLDRVRSMILRDHVETLENRVTALERRPQAFEILLGLAALIAAVALLIGAIGFYKSMTRSDTAVQPVAVATVPAPAGSGTTTPPAVAPPATTAPASASVVVQRGDTLWDIFVSRLGRMPTLNELIRYSTAHGLSYWTDEAGRLIVIIYPGQVLADLPK